MDPALKSILTSLIVAVCGGGLAAIGITTTQGQTTVAQAIVGVAALIVGAVVTWWKSRQHTPQAAIDAINKPNNGLKVVTADVPAPTVTVPLKGDTK
jgi:hypothetical protein